MWTCTDHQYAVVIRTVRIWREVWVVCTTDHCDYELYLGRRLRWRE